MADSSKEIQAIVKHVKDHSANIQYNENLFEIREGDLLSQLEVSLREQLSGNSADIALQRAAPINILNKIVSKLSKSYVSSPTRTAGNPADQELIDYYVENGVDQDFQDFSESFNTYKSGSIEIYENTDRQRLETRSVPPHLSLPFNRTPVDPMRVDGWVKLMGEHVNIDNSKVQKLWIYEPNNFTAVDIHGKLILEDMQSSGGLNPFGVIPAMYMSKSRYKLIPIMDSDTLRMVLLIPILMTDLNFASMFLSMPILYGIDIDAQNIKFSPNHLWNVKSSGHPDTNPQLGVLKAEPDLEGQMANIISQVSLWLETKNIKPGSIGKLSVENFSSGISKLISEMDTIEDRQAQEIAYRNAEKDFWYRLATMHNILAPTGRLENRQKFSDPKNLNIQIKYGQEKVLEGRDIKVKRLKEEVDAGFTTKKKAILELNPEMDDTAADELIEEIKEEKAANAPDIPPVVPGMDTEEDDAL